MSDYRLLPENRIKDMLFDRNIHSEGLLIELVHYLESQMRLARIDELETFEWNDPHRHIHTRLEYLRSHPHRKRKTVTNNGLDDK